jgi:hypothetical protein
MTQKRPVPRPRLAALGDQNRPRVLGIDPGAEEPSQPHKPTDDSELCKGCPAVEDPEDVRWVKLQKMRFGASMGSSLIDEAVRPHSSDRGNTSALARDRFSPWRR